MTDIQINEMMTANKVKKVIFTLQRPLGKVPGPITVAVIADYITDSRVLCVSANDCIDNNPLYIHLDSECTFKQGDILSIDLDGIISPKVKKVLSLDLGKLGMKGRQLISSWFTQNTLSHSYLTRWQHLFEDGEEYILLLVSRESPNGYKVLTVGWGTNHYKLPTNTSPNFKQGDVLALATSGKLIKVGSMSELEDLVTEVLEQ